MSGDYLSIGWEYKAYDLALKVISADNMVLILPNTSSNTTLNLAGGYKCASNSDCTVSTNPCDDNGTCNLASNSCKYAHIDGCVNGAALDTWWGIDGFLVSSLRSDSQFLDHPNVIISLNEHLGTNQYWGDSFE